jgi:hypothetical protein
MRAAVVILSSLSLTSAAAAAAAATQVSDFDYLKANRCRGIAAGLGVDASALNAYVKAQGQSRNAIVQQQADEEFAKAKREAHGDAKSRLSAELSGACAAYMNPSPTMASRQSPSHSR